MQLCLGPNGWYDFRDLAVGHFWKASEHVSEVNIRVDEEKQIRSDLEAYCSRDTYGMILILTALKRLAEL